ncbi:MAG: hypothetical protein LC122_12660 [Chitinophagales bacterium]|nr:hypothetical protein [Chitinophagales bacterium]
MEKNARSKSKDQAQESIRSSKENWNKRVSKFIDDTIHLKKMVNGYPSKFYLQRGKITQPLPVEPSKILSLLTSEYKEIADEYLEIAKMQQDYATKRMQKESSINIEASNKLTRFRSYLSGPFFGDDEKAELNRMRKVILSSFADIYYATKKLNSNILKRDAESIHEAANNFNTFTDNLNAIIKLIKLETSKKEVHDKPEQQQEQPAKPPESLDKDKKDKTTSDKKKEDKKEDKKIKEDKPKEQAVEQQKPSVPTEEIQRLQPGQRIQEPIVPSVQEKEPELKSEPEASVQQEPTISEPEAPKKQEPKVEEKQKSIRKESPSIDELLVSKYDKYLEEAEENKKAGKKGLPKVDINKAQIENNLMAVITSDYFKEYVSELPGIEVEVIINAAKNLTKYYRMMHVYLNKNLDYSFSTNAVKFIKDKIKLDVTSYTEFKALLANKLNEIGIALLSLGFVYNHLKKNDEVPVEDKGEVLFLADSKLKRFINYFTKNAELFNHIGVPRDMPGTVINKIFSEQPKKEGHINNTFVKEGIKAIDWTNKLLHQLRFYDKTSPIRLKISKFSELVMKVIDNEMNSLEADLDFGRLFKTISDLSLLQSKIFELMQDLADIARNTKYTGDIQSLLKERYYYDTGLDEDLVKKLEKRLKEQQLRRLL